jgi:2'-5' RNA ligase
MRLFVAIDLDDRARAAVAAEQKRLAALDPGGSPLRWVRSEQLHLTIAFIGEVEESRASLAASALSEGVDQPPFEVVFEGLGVFPPRGAPRALWVGVGRGEAALRALAHGIAEVLARAGFVLEGRPFSPHLTLARWKTSRPGDRLRILAEGAGPRRSAGSAPGIQARVAVDHATLYCSRLSSSGPSYTGLARANLTSRV